MTVEKDFEIMKHIENDQEIESLEAQFPAASGIAFSLVRWSWLPGKVCCNPTVGRFTRCFPMGSVVL